MRCLGTEQAERFGLAYHMQKRDFDGYGLTVAKGGPKLTPAASADARKGLTFWARGLLSTIRGSPYCSPGIPRWRERTALSSPTSLRGWRRPRTS